MKKNIIKPEIIKQYDLIKCLNYIEINHKNFFEDFMGFLYSWYDIRNKPIVYLTNYKNSNFLIKTLFEKIGIKEKTMKFYNLR